MSQPTACDRAGSCPDPTYCQRCDVLVGLTGFHVVRVAENSGRVRVVIESPPALQGCHCFGRPVELVWRKRTWRCAEPRCAVGSWTEQHDDLAAPRALLSVRSCWWAIAQLRREHASVAGLARQLGTTWRTVWRSIEPLLEAMAADPRRFENVTCLGVDEHIWHHVSTKRIDAGGRGPKELTGMVDLTRDQHGCVRARLLDLVPGRLRRGLRRLAHRAWRGLSVPV